MISQAEKDGAQILIPAGFEEAYLSEDEKDWDSFLGEMHDGIDYAKITVYRCPTNERGMPVKRQMAYLFDCGLNDYSFSQLCGRIRDEYHSGIYKIQVRDKDNKLRKNKQIAIEAPKTENSKTSEGGAGEVIDRMSLAMQEQSDRFERMMQGNRGPQIDPVGQMTQMMTAMGTMMAALGLGGNQAPPQTALEKMMEMKMMKDIVGEMMGGDAEGGGKVDSMWGAIAAAAQSFGGPLMQAIAMAQQNGVTDENGVLIPAAPALAAPANTETPVPTEKPKEDEIPMNVQEMKMQLEFLLNQAKAEVPTEQAVAFVVDLLPDTDEAVNGIEDFLSQENCIDQCIIVVPEIAEHREWFEGWRKGMLATLNEMFEDAPISEDAGEAVDTGNDTDAKPISADDTGATASDT